MIRSFRHPRLLKAAVLLGLWIIALSFHPMAFGDAEEDAKQAKIDSQQEIKDSFGRLDFRINNLDNNDPRKSVAKDKLEEARKKKDAFVNLSTDDADFDTAENDAIKAISEVNRYFMQPVQPGGNLSEKKPGTVPGSGDEIKTIKEDFIPTLVRLLFRFTSLMILISFVVSGVMFIIAYDNEEFVTKAKQMLYYSLLGFAFVALAYAIVKGITQINYFGII